MRLSAVFAKEDGVRQVLLTGEGARDHVFVDLATGALPMDEALESEAQKRGFALCLRVGPVGEVTCANEHMSRVFEDVTAAQSTDPAARGARQRPLPAQEGSRPPGDQVPSATSSADALRAGIGRVARAIERFDGPVFVSFPHVGQLLHPRVVPDPRARHVLNEIGQLLSSGRGNTGSRIVVTVLEDVLDDARRLLTALDHGSAPWTQVKVGLPTEEEITACLDRVRLRSGASGVTSSVAQAFVQRRASMSRVVQASRRITTGECTDLSELVGSQIDERALEIVWAKFDALVGLTELKERMRQTVAQVAGIQAAIRGGERVLHPSTHMLLLGRPGTGKTEVAKLVGELLTAAGVRRLPRFHRVDPSDILSPFNAGDTVHRMREAIIAAAGGVLFIDEAYSLAETEWGGQAIDTLVSAMEERRGDLTVILAGYPDRMNELLQANEGLESRLPNRFTLPDYSPDELCEICDRLLSRANITPDPAAKARAHQIIRRESQRPHANARDVRTHVERWCQRRAAAGDKGPMSIEHIDDPRHWDFAGARDEIIAYEAKFIGLEAPRDWMRDCVRAAEADAQVGRLPQVPRLVFSGPPGTGKTETAMALGRVLRCSGVLRDGTVHKVSLQDLCGTYTGESEQLTRNAFRKAREAVLFIDEIYRFAEDQASGRAILHQLVDHLTDPEFKSVCVVVAGYQSQMESVYRVNPGLQDRFSGVVPFSWPSNEVLSQIAIDHLKHQYDLEVAPSARCAVELRIAEEMAARSHRPGFAGARTAKLVAESIRTAVVARDSAALTFSQNDIPKPGNEIDLAGILAAFDLRFPERASLRKPLQTLLARLSLARLQVGESGAVGVRVSGATGCGKSTFVHWLIETLGRNPDGSRLPSASMSALSLQGTHLGQAQAAVRAVFEQNRGGFVFLDEFHALSGSHSRGEPNMYSQEVVREIVAQMTMPANRGTCLIAAGYPDGMEQTFALDPGLARRFGVSFEIDQATDAELAAMAYRRLRDECKGHPAVSWETIEPSLVEFFARRRARSGVGFGGCAEATGFVGDIKERAWIRGNGLVRDLSIDLEDILGALRQ